MDKMIFWSDRITITDNLAHQAYLGNDLMVDFTYIHKSGREDTRKMSLFDAISFAELRRSDKRYKNFEFLIS